MSDDDLYKLKNKYELPLFFICAIINAIVFFGIFIMFVYFDNITIAYYIAFLLIFLNLFLSLGSTFSVTRLYSVKVDSNQFSWIYDIAREYSKILGLKKMPDIYIRQNGGIINAFASYFLFKSYVQINSDIVDTAYINNDTDAVAFILAHEMAHIAYNHNKLWYNAGILISKFIPFLYSSLSRAREYSCDNVAKKICPSGRHGIFLLLLGKHLYNNIDIKSYMSQALNTRGWFLFYTNLKSTHPVPVRRITALYDMDKQRIIF